MHAVDNINSKTNEYGARSISSICDPYAGRDDMIRLRSTEYYVYDNGSVYHLDDVGGHSLNLEGTVGVVNVSHFDGCPHFYGRYYCKDGFIYEIEQLMTKEFLEEGKRTGGDWTGYVEGQYTRRFLSESSLLNAGKCFDVIFKTIYDA